MRGLPPRHQVVEGDMEVSSQGDQVIHVRAGRARLPLLYSLAGDAHQASELFLGESGLTAQVEQALLKIHM